MLVLARKLNEKILIGVDIEITVVGIAGDTVRLGIQAPKAVKILRSEVYEEIENQNKEAATRVNIENQEVSGKLKEMLKGQIMRNE